MDNIIITFESTALIDISVLLNNIVIPHQIADDQIIIDTDVLAGINNLRISTNQHLDEPIKILDLTLNDVSLRQTLYLAYSEIDDVKVCNTWLTNRCGFVIIPFGNPVSWWLTECAKKIPNKIYGTNLFEKYEIYYPESVNISNKFPKLMQDFMKYDFGFTMVDKTKPVFQNTTVPWLKINFNYNEQELLDEFNNNIDIIKNNYYEPKQNQYNNKESKIAPNWIVAMAVHRDNSRNKPQSDDGLIDEFDKTSLPAFYSVLDRIKAMNIKILHAFIGVVEPGSYVAQHCDDLYKHIEAYKDAVGVTQIFIPIGWKPGNVFKFNNVGVFPMDQGAYVVNNSEFMHGSINESDTTRYSIGIYCAFTEQNIKDLTAVL